MDLFSVETDPVYVGRCIVIAHCVSACLTMGKGIAVTFREKYGRVDELNKLDPHIGDVLCLQHTLADRQFLVCYLITKEKYWQKPTYDALQTCLRKLATITQQYGHIAVMPRLGCGLDCLDWSVVSGMIANELKDVPYRVYG